MGYLMNKVGTLTPEDATEKLREVLLHLAQVIEETETAVANVPEEQEQPESQ